MKPTRLDKSSLNFQNHETDMNHVEGWLTSFVVMHSFTWLPPKLPLWFLWNPKKAPPPPPIIDPHLPLLFKHSPFSIKLGFVIIVIFCQKDSSFCSKIQWIFTNLSSSVVESLRNITVSIKNYLLHWQGSNLRTEREREAWTILTSSCWCRDCIQI